MEKDASIGRAKLSESVESILAATNVFSSLFRRHYGTRLVPASAVPSNSLLRRCEFPIKDAELVQDVEMEGKMKGKKIPARARQKWNKRIITESSTSIPR
ncbi:hypothetical protein KM043_000394 [Ampulex compressa]|nr:hypothetical protein KM043_000394 [Ampulex compressa]